jgi:hypothetical protein
MTKGDLIWVLIRGTGFLLVVRALFSIKDFLYALVQSSYDGPEGTDFAKLWAQTALSNLVEATITAVFCLVVGVYLLRGGNWIFRLINHVPRERSNTTPHPDARDVPASAGGSGARAGERER